MATIGKIFAIIGIISVTFGLAIAAYLGILIYKMAKVSKKAEKNEKD